jgi:hypothetical protein
MSEVSICNLALGYLGDTANVTSISPPENSVQAQLCAQFYPIARDAMLEMGSWGFATTRKKLALLATNPAAQGALDTNGMPDASTWAYCYAQPADMVNALAVLSAEASNDYEANYGVCDPSITDFPRFPQGYLPVPGSPTYTPQPYALETLENGTEIVLTNVPDAVLRYTKLVTDTAKFSPLFTLGTSHMLASMLAGPILKGDKGAAEAKNQLALALKFESTAEASDANQRKNNIEPAVSWIRGR